MERGWYEPVKAGGIGAELMNFFHRKNAEDLGDDKYIPRTLDDFLGHCQRYHKDKHENLGFYVREFCHNLIAQGQLFSVGFNPKQRLPYNEQFISYRFYPDLAAYGSYDFIALGFPEIRRAFEQSVIRLEVKTRDGNDEFGTGFLMEQNRLITASHCVESGYSVRIDGWDPTKAKLTTIQVRSRPSTDRPLVDCRDLIDLAVLQFESDPFPDARKFDLAKTEILADVLVMGYPQMPGFLPVLVAGTGQIIGQYESTARRQDLMLVDARVTGGNSGGPVINRYGRVVGVITNAFDDMTAGEDNIEKNGLQKQRQVHRLDYGIATPARTLYDFLKVCEDDSKILKIRHNVSGDVIKVMM